MLPMQPLREKRTREYSGTAGNQKPLVAHPGRRPEPLLVPARFRRAQVSRRPCREVTRVTVQTIPVTATDDSVAPESLDREPFDRIED